MHLWLAWVALSSLSPVLAALPTGQERPGTAHAATEFEPPRRGFFPWAGTVVAGSGVAGGVGYRYERFLDSPLGAEAAALWSVRGYQLYRGRFGFTSELPHTLRVREADAGVAEMFNDSAVKRPGTALFVEGRWRSYPRHPFFGIGSNAERENRSAYKLKGPGYDLVGQWQVTHSFGLSGRAGVLESRVERGHGDVDWPSVEKRFDPDTIPGFSRSPRLAVFGVGAAFDRRDSPRDPARGYFVGATLWRFEADGPGFDFTRGTLDARAFIPPGSLPGVLAFRLLVSADRAAEDAAVPFFLLQTLGGGETLRSYSSHRWRERALAHLTVEYRWHPHKLVEIAPFLDVASLGRSVGRLSPSQRLYSYGVALRGHWRGRAIGRIEWAAGPEGQKFVISTGPIF